MREEIQSDVTCKATLLPAGRAPIFGSQVVFGLADATIELVRPQYVCQRSCELLWDVSRSSRPNPDDLAQIGRTHTPQIAIHHYVMPARFPRIFPSCHNRIELHDGFFFSANGISQFQQDLAHTLEAANVLPSGEPSDGSACLASTTLESRLDIVSVNGWPEEALERLKQDIERRYPGWANRITFKKGVEAAPCQACGRKLASYKLRYE